MPDDTQPPSQPVQPDPQGPEVLPENVKPAPAHPDEPVPAEEIDPLVVEAEVSPDPDEDQEESPKEPRKPAELDNAALEYLQVERALEQAVAHKKTMEQQIADLRQRVESQTSTIGALKSQKESRRQKLGAMIGEYGEPGTLFLVDETTVLEVLSGPAGVEVVSRKVRRL